ncbi:hypothetical protein [Bacillus mycoides]|uniref:Uncharacterized protein n=1 Tax=Bacillus mycoides TaxID=1405 RepID=A0A4U3A568_BACMY|nr:hypothetical protein [Bacillus mycoides]TKI83014.1 hypothetical protein FC701_19290 [Bacillus mycoides]
MSEVILEKTVVQEVLPDVQDIMKEEILEEDTSSESIETVQLFQYMKENSVPLNSSQMKGILLLNENGCKDIADYVISVKKQSLPLAFYEKVLKILTMFDRIKGNAKLSHLLKANANPSLSLSANSAKVVKGNELA